MLALCHDNILIFLLILWIRILRMQYAFVRDQQN